MSRYLFKDGEQRDPSFRYGNNEPSSSWSGIRLPQSVDGSRASSVYSEGIASVGDPFGAGTFPANYFGELTPEPISDGAMQTPIANICIGVVDFVSKVAISHPCTVLRRQCQVHQSARSLHLTPFTFAPVVCNIISNEGVQTLWKGAIGSGMLWALSAATEVLIAEFFGLPRTVIRQGSTKKFWRHIVLKMSSYLAMTPFIVSSFIETVRSETGLGRDDFRVMDVITNGVNRLKSDFMKRDGSKRFSLFYLAAPTVAYQTSHYLIAHVTYGWIYNLARRYVNKKPASERTTFHQYFPDLFAMMSSQVVADFVCYPFDTVLHRLYIQGTRTLIDNLDTGVSAISINAKYTGFVDCLQRIINRETAWALYAGVGALALQYLLNFSFLRVMRTAFDYAVQALADNNHGIPMFIPPRPSSPPVYEASLHASSSCFPQSTAPSMSSEYPSFGQTAASLGRRSPPDRLGSFDYPFGSPTGNPSFRSTIG